MLFAFLSRAHFVIKLPKKKKKISESAVSIRDTNAVIRIIDTTTAAATDTAIPTITVSTPLSKAFDFSIIISTANSSVKKIKYASAKIKNTAQTIS